MPKIQLQLGTTYGNWTAISYSHTSDYKPSYLCKCICGAMKVVNAQNIIYGKSKSCGCINRNNLISKNTKHGLWKHPLHNTWMKIIQRCESPTCKSYKYYGGRGIKICDEWKNNFQVFYDWAISNGWRQGLQIDRYPNKYGNYEPSNCRCVESKINNRNRTDCVMNDWRIRVVFNLYNKKYSIKEISQKYRTSYDTIWQIVHKKTWV